MDYITTRQAHERTGIDPKYLTDLCRMDRVRTPSGTAIKPGRDWLVPADFDPSRDIEPPDPTRHRLKWRESPGGREREKAGAGA